MKLEDYPKLVAEAVEATSKQDAYVKSLGESYTSGERTIKIYDEAASLWTTINLAEFFTIQHIKYVAMAGYSGELSGLLANLEALLDSSLGTIVLPADRNAATEAA